MFLVEMNRSVCSRVGLVLTITMLLAPATNALHVLILYPTPSFSHQIPVMGLTEKLIDGGHKVTVVGPNRVPGLTENYTFVDMSFCYKYFSPDDDQDIKVDLQKKMTKWEVSSLMLGIHQVMEVQYTSEPFRRFLRDVENEQFDIVIIEAIFPYLLVPLARKIVGSKPIVGFITVSINHFIEPQMGNFEHLSFVPSMLSEYSDKMTLLEKIENWFSHRYIISRMNQDMKAASRKFFSSQGWNESVLLVENAVDEISIGMAASNFIYYYPRLLGPNFIEVGPLHLKPPAPLPKNLQDWCDQAEKGVIYMSLGSNMKSKSLPTEVRDNFLRVFNELPAGYRVLWKWELDGKIPGQSNNILPQKWFPQHSVLAHPKVKVFITQGGLQSFQEAVHYGVPLIGIPWFGDQELDVTRMVDLEIGLRIRPHELISYERIKGTINALISDEKYSKNMRRISAISQDFTARSSDLAIFWIEHIARHGRGEHLKPITASATHFEFFCLDIISFIFVSTVILLYLTYAIFKFLCTLLFKQINNKMKKS